MLDQPLCLLDHHFGDGDVARGRFVESRAHDFAANRAGHVGDLFRTLIDQQDDEVDFRVIRRDGMRDVLQHHRLAGPGRGDDEAALALAERRDQVDHPGRQVLLRRHLDLELQAPVGIERRQIVEVDPVADLVRILEVDGVDLEQREVALAFFRAADLAVEGVAGAQAEAADLRGRDIDVIGAG